MGESPRASDHFIVSYYLELPEIRAKTVIKKKKLLSRVQLCDPMDCSPPGSSVCRISQARVLGRVAILFSRGSSDPGIDPRSPTLQGDSLLPESPETVVIRLIIGN